MFGIAATSGRYERHLVRDLSTWTAVRFTGMGPDEYRKVLSVGVSLAAAVVIFPYAINLVFSRGYVAGQGPHGRAAVGREPAVANLVTGLALSAGTVAVAAFREMDGVKAPRPRLGTRENRHRPAPRPCGRTPRVRAPRSLWAFPYKEDLGE
jgi:hypothetical protein